MEKRSDVSSDSRTRVSDEVVEPKDAVKTNKPKNVTVLVRNLHPAIVKVAVQSGKEYLFNGSGAEVKVKSEDVEELLAKRRGGCCGGSESPMFELV